MNNFEVICNIPFPGMKRQHFPAMEITFSASSIEEIREITSMSASPYGLLAVPTENPQRAIAQGPGSNPGGGGFVSGGSSNRFASKKQLGKLAYELGQRGKNLQDWCRENHYPEDHVPSQVAWRTIRDLTEGNADI